MSFFNRHYVRTHRVIKNKRICKQKMKLGSNNVNYGRMHVPLSDMPILGFSNSAGNKDMMSKILTNGDTIT